MPSDDRHADAGTPARSLSEQLRDLEAELGYADEMSRPLQGRRSKLPMSLGRPIGLTQPDGFPRILTIGEDADPNYNRVPVRRSGLRRGVAVAGAVLTLFVLTAILPPLIWRYAEPPLPVADVEVPSLSPGRTDQFAMVARDLARAPHAPTRLPTVDSLIPPVETRRSTPEVAPVAETAASTQATTLEVAESELPSLTLPKIVSGMAPASAGSAVVIDGLPGTARVLPGIRIARDSWAVGIRDVDYAVLSLPRDTPERLDLVVRVVAADSQQLAAKTLQIRVLRTAHATEPRRAAEVPSQSAPRARFEPASGLGEPGLEAVVPLPERKPIVVLKRAPAPSPAWPTSVSTWSQTETKPAPPLTRSDKAPAWSPF